MGSMWVLICINQLIAYIPLMSISFPSNMLLLFNMLSFFNGDLYIFQLLYDNTVGLLFHFPTDPIPYTQQFALIGYDSVKLMDNSGVFISLWVLLLFAIPILLVTPKICTCQCCNRSSNRLLRCVVWGPILRTFLVTFLELGFCGYINMMFISFESAADIFSSLISLAVIITLALLPFLLLHILSAIPSTLRDQNFKQKYGEVYNDLDYPDNYVAGFYYPVFILHRFFFIAIVFGVSFSGHLQCSFMIAATSLFLVFLVKCKPFSLQLDRFLNIFATVILIILYFFCFVLALLDESSYLKEREVIGYFFISLVLLFFTFTSVLILVSKVRLCISHKRKKMKIQEPERLNGSETEAHLANTSQRQLPKMISFYPRMELDIELAQAQFQTQIESPQALFREMREVKEAHYKEEGSLQFNLHSIEQQEDKSAQIEEIS